MEYLNQIWDSKIVTNNGPFHREFEAKLADYLGVPFVSLFSNGTLALMTALHALEIKGEVITTPYSFVASTHALWWNDITPVFVDVDPVYANLDASKIEAAITSRTSAIMPVHVYGNPCDVQVIQSIANKHGLKVIYDAAHAFGVQKQGQSILNFGDLSVLSFHATKVFHTIEGGAIISQDANMKQHIDQLKNFGFVDEVTVTQPGINGKMNELQAALGLLQLNTIDQEINMRKELVALYRQQLLGMPGISTLKDMDEVVHNYSYFPIFVEEDNFGKSRDKLYEELKTQNIYGRRYYYPLISSFPPYDRLGSSLPHLLPNAHDRADKVICLPLFKHLQNKDVVAICKIISTSGQCL